MAKSKHSAALFEVINRSKQPEQAAQSLRTPKWWFKGKGAKSESASAPVESSPVAVVTQTASPSPAVATVAPPSRPAAVRSAPQSDSRSSTVHMDFDRHRKEITLRLRYTTAIVTAFGLCVVIGIAYIVGRRLNRGPQVASGMTATSVQQLLQRPAQPGVIDVSRAHQARTNVANPTPARRLVSSTIVPVRPTPVYSLVPAGAETRMPRAIGLNYAIIQTYPPEELQSAEAARDFLTKNGIPCTIEKTDYVHNPNWVCLVGTAGFARISSGDYKQYVQSIVSLGAKFPSSHFDRFRPAAYKWKG